MTDLAALARALDERIDGRVETDQPLAGFTTYRLGGPAAVYIEPATADDLRALGEVLRAEGDGVPVMALGRGSNLLISDEGWPGVAVRLGDAFAFTKEVGASGLRAGSATPLPVLANWAARRGLAGLEFSVAIPGAVGGAVKMNAGAHGGQVSDHLASALLFDLSSLVLEERPAERLGLTYRHSNLRPSDIVVEAIFELEADDPTAIRARMAAFRRHRAETQPGAVQNAGSIFKNPPGDSAGRLVEGAGLKGHRVGGAEVSQMHANFFIAHPGATAQDVHDLIADVRVRVREASGIDLDPEIRFIGSFE
ncbi:MAG TPA: UDP-N-acetylmuramate dehydrogenase [Actinomycetota bacterium]|nr:UDP-N-acetylmuramate dehydrogenase [Actinomycetota bacterium]